jgi:eukaryotic-like serine/threonine-protein kinase
MSPEQAELGGVDITTATDVYSLGVLLHELLVSALPFDPAMLRRAGYAEIQRTIREEEPVPPSSRLSALGTNAVPIAHQRRTDVSALVREIKGDLDWIVLKALEKSPDRRYSSASELAADVSRYLQSDRVLARPSSFRSRLRKLAKQHPIRVRVAAVVSVLIAHCCGWDSVGMDDEFRRSIVPARCRARGNSAYSASKRRQFRNRNAVSSVRV